MVHFLTNIPKNIHFSKYVDFKAIISKFDISDNICSVRFLASKLYGRYVEYVYPYLLRYRFIFQY